MRLAIVAASSYEENGQVDPIPNAKLDVERFGDRLAEADAGFRVYALAAKRGLAEGLDELIASLGERPSVSLPFLGLCAAFRGAWTHAHCRDVTRSRAALSA
jgi:hypothetical protein